MHPQLIENWILTLYKSFASYPCAAQLGTASSTVVAFHTAEPLAALVFVLVTLVVVFKVFLTSAVFNLNPQVIFEQGSAGTRRHDVLLSVRIL